MQLHLINKNYSENDNNQPTCQTHCLFYDNKTAKCGYFNNEVPKDALYTAKCNEYIGKEEWEGYTDDILSEENSVESSSAYPFVPQEGLDREDAVWYVSPDEQFGCWIISLSEKQRFMTINSLQINKELIRSGKYRSPYPLHNHGYEGESASQIAWVIDEQGIGQYAWVIAGDIIFVN